MTSSTDSRIPGHHEAEEPASLSPAEFECLRCIAGHIIPASDEFGVPGADDEAIVGDMVRSIGRDKEELRRALRDVTDAAGGALDTLVLADQAALLARLRETRPGGLSVVEAVVSRSYYRDERVLRSIGMEPRPPFPRGYPVDQGDWSLLDPVRKRLPMYRDAG
ncbi:MAG TPA: hypothetical protein VNS34_21935 [Rhizobiaceae bacterium]|nr:hypothetical protein [Rhizobiaceae bacterium]